MHDSNGSVSIVAKIKIPKICTSEKKLKIIKKNYKDLWKHGSIMGV